MSKKTSISNVNPREYVNVNNYNNLLNAELNPICHLLAILGAHHIFHVSRIRVKINRQSQLKFLLSILITH